MTRYTRGERDQNGVRTHLVLDTLNDRIIFETENEAMRDAVLEYENAREAWLAKTSGREAIA